MRDLKSYGKPLKIEYDKERHLGRYYIVPIDISAIKGWNYSVRDTYDLKCRINTKSDNGLPVTREWVFINRERSYFKPDYYDEEKRRYVECKCEDCVAGQKERPDLDKNPEILLAKDFDL